MGELQKAATQHNREAAALSLVRRRLVEAETQLDRMGFENEVCRLSIGLCMACICMSGHIMYISAA